jgi:TetR/AcrR family transcriptional repressor of bet genes
MNTRKRRTAGAPAPRARAGHGRQRLHLIDSCISALHAHGPSRTTVEKVVAIAKMSPGIVRFYFDSKAAMLIASLEFLAAEFEERLLVPVAQIKHNPVAALELLIKLYLDSDIASARKISVWYAFWGEANSRQEYYDICGQKDQRFAALVHALIERLIVDTGQRQLDPDGIALGLIGVLEMLWQGFAFQQEATIDRAAARHRCMAYLRSIFPEQFGARPVDRQVPAVGVRWPAVGAQGTAVSAARRSIDAAGGAGAGRYADAERCALERARLFQDVWQGVGHASDLPRAGDYLAVDIGAERALLIRDAAGCLQAYRNSCPVQPHRLVAEGRGGLDPMLHCRTHGLRFDWGAGGSAMGLSPLRLRQSDGCLFIAVGAATDHAPLAEFTRGLERFVRAGGSPVDITLEADWKLIVEQWLELSLSGDGDAAGALRWDDIEVAIAPDLCTWQARLRTDSPGWSASHYADLSGAKTASRWQRRFLFPNQFLELRPDGASMLSVVPLGPARSRLLRTEFAGRGDGTEFAGRGGGAQRAGRGNPAEGAGRGGRVERAAQQYAADPIGRISPALRFLAHRLTDCFRPRWRDFIETLQRGIAGLGHPEFPREPSTAAHAAFRTHYNRLLAGTALFEGDTHELD